MAGVDGIFGYAAVALGGALACGLLGRELRRLSRRARACRRVARAHRGERDAARLLRARGYRIEARQPTVTWTIECAGAPHSVTLRPDLIVARGRRRFVAEVKTGARAPSVASPATRRQLLEYSVACGAHGVLLVDAERDRVCEVIFRARSGPAPSRAGPRPAAAVAIVAALGLAAAATAAALALPWPP